MSRATFSLVINRVWAMPSRYTFTIEPIRELVARWMALDDWRGGPSMRGWIDPFAGWHSPAEFTNDLNPAAPTQEHVDAEEFVRRFDSIYGILFDPPYSPRQIAECYKQVGRKVGMEETQNATLYARVKNAANERMPYGALAICCGWNSTGFGESRGFQLLEVLMVPHGGAHNDTIVTVERKVALL